MRHLRLACVLLVLLAVPALAGDAYLMPTDQFTRFRNPDGSCVQCSIAMAGVHHGVPSAEFLLWNSPYGPAVRGGSWPARVAQYAGQRNIPIYNIEGSETIQWIEWALQTGRYAAITYGVRHMITAVGISDDKQTFYVVDNNLPSQVQAVSRSRFISQHRGYGGGWTVILKGPAPAAWKAPQYVAWWANG